MLSVAAAFVLFGLLHGLTAPFDRLIGEMSDTRLRVQSRVNVTQGLPIGYLSRIEGVPGVTGVDFGRGWAATLLGGLWPAIRAATLPVATALRKA
jgi:hypothetical protein